jgi:hypothetical protein
MKSINQIRNYDEILIDALFFRNISVENEIASFLGEKSNINLGIIPTRKTPLVFLSSISIPSF